MHNISLILLLISLAFNLTSIILGPIGGDTKKCFILRCVLTIIGVSLYLIGIILDDFIKVS